MAEIRKRISFDEFSHNLTGIIEQVLSEGKSIVIEKGEGELVEVKPVTSSKSGRRVVTHEDEAFLSAAGGWADMDVDAFLKDIYESRNTSRPPVEL